MANTYTSIYIHYVFSTKQRQPLIHPDIQYRLWAYIGGIARKNKIKALATGGTTDHVHTLLSLPSTISISKVIQLIKGNSSKWMKENFDHAATNFSWQTGYGAFSINVSIVQETIKYIEKQASHHKTITFKDEYIEFLKKHGIDCDDRYIWD